MKVEVRNLKRCFGNVKAVDGVSFQFGSNDVFGFVGPNGAGKTTTMRILATLDEANEGDAFFEGTSVREYPETIRRCLGFVPDTLPSHGDMSVFEYLDFYGRAYGLRGKQLRKAVEGVEEFTGVGKLRDRLVDSLSKGMKQRVSLGRALIHDPQVLVMDEPAAGLDPRARVELRELLVLLAEQGKAILISSHILTELTEICTGVVMIEQGRLLVSGAIEDVIARNSEVRTLKVRVLDRQEACHKALLETPGVLKVGQAGTEFRVDIAGDEAASADLLGRLVGAGFKVVEFRQQRGDLEDVFLKLTKGEVQ